jgi:predicted metal-dependent enzyme (double-stranded beta helix superfamily)
MSPVSIGRRSTVTDLASVEPATEVRPGLSELVERIRQRTRPATDAHTTARAVADILTELRPTPRLLTDEERAGSADGYTRHTLHAEATFSISAVVWRPGQLTEIHDHLVWCSFVVLQGTETENLFDIDGDRLVQVGRLQRPAGSVSGVAPPDDIHQVHNTGDSVAITLHVYGADLSAGTSVRRTYHQR